MRRAIQYGDARIVFTIDFVRRPMGRVAITVLPTSTVRVAAPEGVEPSAVVDAVRKRARWIWQQQEAHRLRRVHVLPREYVSGESHFYLGRRHMLKVKLSTVDSPGVKLLRGRLEVTTPDREPKVVRKLLDAWYREHAHEVFSKRMAECAKRMHWLKTLPGVRLLNMKTQWGSCSPKGDLLLNPQLVKAPRACIDYVVVHELCHLKEHNHSVQFYHLLASVLPDWQARKQELDGMAELILNR